MLSLVSEQGNLLVILSQGSCLQEAERDESENRDCLPGLISGQLFGKAKTKQLASLWDNASDSFPDCSFAGWRRGQITMKEFLTLTL